MGAEPQPADEASPEHRRQSDHAGDIVRDRQAHIGRDANEILFVEEMNWKGGEALDACILAAEDHRIHARRGEHSGARRGGQYFT